MRNALQLGHSCSRRLHPPDLAALAVRALLDEAHLTPKPGLVDRRGSGAHHDMTLVLLECSVAAIAPGIDAMVNAAAGQPVSLGLREALGRIGRETEAAMLRTTGGVNTHRGAIWTMGLLASAAVMDTRQTDPHSIAAKAAALARLPDRFAPSTATHGNEVERRFGCAGARGEAVTGFPHVLRYGLTALHAARVAGATKEQAQTDALLAIMANLQDTCLLHRGGWETLQITQAGAADVLARGGASTAEGRLRLNTLDQVLLRLWASPGGSADLLGATLFLDSLQTAAQMHPISVKESPHADHGL